MLVSESHKFVFLAIPKTGTRSTYKVLSREPYFGKNIGDHKHILPSKYKDFYKFTFVRDPYERMFSLYWSCCVKSGDMKGFLADMSDEGFATDFKGFLQWVVKHKDRFYDLNQSKYLILKSQASFFISNRFDAVIKMEDISDKLTELPFIEKGFALPHLNKSNYDPETYRKYFDSEVFELINFYCSEEFDLTGYEKRSSI
jgi:hypothetical protein